jgi:predicted secreted hydrolase
VLARTFRQALPGYTYAFPKDHASHEEYKTEWWYYTGHLNSEDGRKFGYELTFFRTGLENSAVEKTPWDVKNIYLAHFAVSDESNKKFLFYEKLNRAGLNTATARPDNYQVVNETWSVEQLGNDFVLRADAPNCSLHLLLSSLKPPVIHGTNGISQKASCKGCASHYYSMTRLKSSGYLYLNNAANKVTGNSWMDHEFGSNQLTSEQVGWDWYSLQLDNNSELMLYVMRRSDGTLDNNSSGTIVNADGTSKHLNLADFKIGAARTWISSATGAHYPMDWSIKIPSAKLDLTVKSAFENQELNTKQSTGVAYWEGAASVSGTQDNRPVTGQAYVEMTGYAEKFRKNI